MNVCTHTRAWCTIPTHGRGAPYLHIGVGTIPARRGLPPGPQTARRRFGYFANARTATHKHTLRFGSEYRDTRTSDPRLARTVSTTTYYAIYMTYEARRGEVIIATGTGIGTTARLRRHEVV